MRFNSSHLCRIRRFARLKSAADCGGYLISLPPRFFFDCSLPPPPPTKGIWPQMSAAAAADHWTCVRAWMCVWLLRL